MTGSSITLPAIVGNTDHSSENKIQNPAIVGNIDYGGENKLHNPAIVIMNVKQPRICFMS